MLKQFLKRTAVVAMAVALAVSLPLGAYAAPKKLSKSIKKGDTVYFGKYEQDGNTKNGKEKIEWKVLDKQGNKALLISKKVLDIQPYNKELEDITWGKCTLRKWLNKDFLKAGFSANEQKKINNTKVVNKDNKTEDWHTKGGKDTTDKIFCLSIDEAKKYFKDDKARIAEITDYSIKQIAKVSDSTEKELKAEYFGESKGWYYWLRSPGVTQDLTTNVDSGGAILEPGFYVFNSIYGCRPALWVNLS